MRKIKIPEIKFGYSDKKTENIAIDLKDTNSAQQKWDKASAETEQIIDSLNCHVDENIKETITALNVFDINTTASCEGHTEKGRGVPWVEIAADNEPDEEYISEKNIIQRIASENNISVDDLKKEEKYENLYRRAEEEFMKNSRTEKAVIWQEENEKLKEIMEVIISDFYQQKDVSEDVKLKFRSIGYLGRFRIIAGSHDDYLCDYETMSETEKKELGNRLEKNRKEIKDFTCFLKDKFFSEGENYINDIKNRVQEKIDKEKIRKIQECIENNI